MNIESDAGGQPSGSSILSFSDVSRTDEIPATYTFSPESVVRLAANTTYWLTVTSSDSVDWYHSSLVNSESADLLSGLYNDSGSWSNTVEHFGLHVDATAVPEPLNPDAGPISPAVSIPCKKKITDLVCVRMQFQNDVFGGVRSADQSAAHSRRKGGCRAARILQV